MTPITSIEANVNDVNIARTKTSNSLYFVCIFILLILVIFSEVVSWRSVLRELNAKLNRQNYILDV